MSRLDSIRSKRLKRNLSPSEEYCNIIGTVCPEELRKHNCYFCFAHKYNFPDLMNKIDEVINEPN